MTWERPRSADVYDAHSAHSRDAHESYHLGRAAHRSAAARRNTIGKRINHQLTHKMLSFSEGTALHKSTMHSEGVVCSFRQLRVASANLRLALAAGPPNRRCPASLRDAACLGITCIDMRAVWGVRRALDIGQTIIGPPW